MNKEDIWIFLIGALIIVVVYAFIAALNTGKKRIEQLQKYWDVKIGMTESEMLNLMGEGYNRSLLKNNRIKYEWRINASSYGSSYKGISSRYYSGVKKVDIYVKNGIVEEVKPYNV